MDPAEFVYMFISVAIAFVVLTLSVGLMVLDRILDYKTAKMCCEHCDHRGGN